MFFGKDERERLIKIRGNDHFGCSKHTTGVVKHSNAIHTTRYTPWNFLFKNAYEQLTTPSNTYFMFIAVLQCIKPISVTNGLPTIMVPLAFVLVVNGLKDLVEDIKRNQADNLENKQFASILRTRVADRQGTNQLIHTLSGKSIELQLSKNSDAGADDCMVFVTEDPRLKQYLKDFDKQNHTPPYSDDSDDEFDHREANSHQTAPNTADGPKGELKAWKRKLFNTHWENIQVGDLVVLFQNDAAPADGIILASGDTRETVFIETSSLDGETSLKIKKPVIAINRLVGGDNEKDLERAFLTCASLSLVAHVEKPSPDLANFRGVCHLGRGIIPLEKWQNVMRNPDSENQMGSGESGPAEDQEVEVIPVNKDNLLLRGCRICHTSWMIMLTAYTGNETKIIMNSTKPARKESKLERRTHGFVIGMFGVMITLCCIASACNFWMKRSSRFAPYYYSGFKFRNNVWTADTGNQFMKQGAIVLEFVISFFTWMLLLTNLIPISLIVSMGLVRTFQAWHMAKDLNMTNANGEGCVVRTSGLNDDLGVVKYIMTDKTGTLTANVMEFHKCAIGSEVYGDELDQEEEDEDFGITKTPHCSCESIKLRQVLRGLGRNDARLEALLFFLNLAINHSALVDENNPGVYIASSPDEEALLYGAKHFGITFEHRLGVGVEINIMGTKHTVYVDYCYAFDSDRKRSTIVATFDVNALAGAEYAVGDGAYSQESNSPNRKHYVFVKGADSHVLPLCQEAPPDTPDLLVEFAEACLRTLVLSYRVLSDDEFNEWKSRLSVALAAGDEKRIIETSDIVERELVYQGITGIEDLLAPEVPETVDALSKAGIRIWMLTGDKFETAFNIGLATNLIKAESRHIVLTESRLNNLSTAQIATTFELLKDLLENRKKKQEAVRKETFWSPVPAGRHSQVSFEQPTDLIRSRQRLSKLLSRDNFGLNREASYSPHQDVPTRRPSKAFRAHSKTSDWAGPKEIVSKVVTAPTGKTRTTTIIWDGTTLRRCLDDPKLESFVFALSSLCDSAIFCRTSPQDKGDVVRLCRKTDPSMTCLSIGDGANDCNMLMAASVGVGIKGREGLQAFNSSDYGITEFRHLRYLLLVHGRWNYRRLAKMVLHTFYKNFVFCMPTYYFAFFSLFSGQKAFSETIYQLYNVALTQLPVLCYGIWDQDVNAELCIAFPQLYKLTSLLRKRTVFYWLLCGVWHSVCVFMIPVHSLTGIHVTDTKSYRPNDFTVVSTMIFLQVMVVVNGKLLLETMCPSWLTLLSLSLSFLFLFLIDYTMSNWPEHFPLSSGSFDTLLVMPMAYFLTFITPVVALSVDIVVAVYDRTFKPELHHLMQFLMRFEQDEKRAKRQLMVEAVKQGGPQLLQAMGLSQAKAEDEPDDVQMQSLSSNKAPIQSRLTHTADDEDIDAALAVHDQEKNQGGVTDVLLEVLQLKPLLEQIKGGFAFAGGENGMAKIAFGQNVSHNVCHAGGMSSRNRRRSFEEH